jgi:hypothetical protein
MRFTAAQYDEAIRNLQDARKQLEPDGDCCSVCGDDGHMAFGCGHNPLVAVALCGAIATRSEQLHETLHWLAGWDSAFGVRRGPAKVIMPDGEG